MCSAEGKDSGLKAKILIVGNEPNVLRLIRYVLEVANYETVKGDFVLQY